MATGQKDLHKGNAPFDPTDFDIDAFIVSDKLASKFSSSSTFWRAGTDLREDRQLQKEIDKTLKEFWDGLRREDKKEERTSSLFAYLRRKNTVVDIKKGGRIN